MKPGKSGKTAEQWAKQLNMEPHPEGGYFKQSYISSGKIMGKALPGRYKGTSRPFGTAIYFLLKGDGFSAFHRLKSDEIWHFYDGSPVEIVIIHPDGRLEKRPLV